MFKGTPVLALILLLSFAIPVVAQNPVQEPTTPVGAPAQDDEVVRVDTNLVQMDVSVTDDEGRAVKGLTPDDFEITENGKPRKISSFSFVSRISESVSGARPAAGTAAAQPAPPSSKRLTQAQGRRTTALVVDNIGLSLESLASVKQGLNKYVDSVLQPDDLVAIITTSGGIGSLQQFTSDKRLLRAAIDRLKVGANGRGVSSFITLEGKPVLPFPQKFRIDIEAPKLRLRALRDELGASSMLSALTTIVSGMNGLPGRKSLIVMSDGYRITTGGNSTVERTKDAIRVLTDLANRSSVVIYTMDARGLAYTGITSNDVTSGLELGPVQQQIEERRNALMDTQRGLRDIARDTGGFAIQNTNDLGRGLERVVADQLEYYLIGYQPDDDSFDPAQLKFINYKIKVKRPGVNVRYRTGFLGVPDQTDAVATADAGAALGEAIVSPFDATGVHLRLTPMFGNDATGSFVRVLLHLNTADLTFTEAPDGGHQATIDLLQVILTDDGRVANEVSKTHKIQLNDELYRRSLADGFVYTASVAIPRPGAYQLRLAVRDEPSKRIGSISQFFDVPDLGNHKLALSGLTLLGVDPALLNTTAASRPATEASAHARVDPLTDAARRKFAPGLILQYGCILYNAGAVTGRGSLKTQTRLLRNGEVAFDSGLTDFTPPAGADPARLSFSSAIRLGSALPPGDYVLQLNVTDPTGKGDGRTATQAIDFEIVPADVDARAK